MKTRKHMFATCAVFVLALIACTGFLFPSCAWADEGIGIGILIPKPAEFFPSLVGFLIIWFVLAKFAWPKVLHVLDERQAHIQENIDKAAHDRAKAAKALHSYEEKIAQAQKEADTIIADARETAESSAQDIIAEAKKQAADIVAKGHMTVEAERQATLAGLTNQVADLSVELTKKVVSTMVSEDDQRKLACDYLAEVGDFDA